MRRRSWLLGAVAVGTGILGGVTGAMTAPTLVVEESNGSELLAVPIDSGSEVTVEYTHSVEKTLVSDVYVVSDGALVMDRMLFSSYGAGLPSNAPVTRRGDRYEYRPPQQRHETLIVSTGPVAKHELIVGEKRYDLFEIADGGTVHIRVENRVRRSP